MTIKQDNQTRQLLDEKEDHIASLKQAMLLIE